MPKANPDNFVSLTGNMTEDPDLRFLGDGTAVCSIRIAVNERKWDRDKNEYVDGEPLFISASVWREYAEHVAESVSKGDRVNIVGRLRIRSYEDKEGETRWVTEVDADEVNVNLRWATARPQKARSSSGAGNRPPHPADNQQTSGGGGDAPPPPDMDDVPF